MKRILLIICVFATIVACKEDEKAALDLSVTPSIIEFSEAESAQKVYITSNCPWTTSSDKDWCIVSILQKFGNDTIEVKALTNNTYYERIAYISIVSPDKSIIKTVKIIQKSLGQQMFRQDDSIVLTKFYDAMDGDNWTNKSGWKTSNLEDWYGVIIKNDRVTGIKMENNNLSGVLFTELAELTALDTISIVSEPNVTGSIPTAITNLSDLVCLNITGTSISGNIPPALENLQALVYLSLSNNDLNGKIPSSLASLSNLKHLILSDNSLSGAIPPEIANLALETLRLENNFLSGPVSEAIVDKLDGDTFNICPQKAPHSFEPDICN
jgi:hypothetical protein